jgi:hypothetical protein
VRLRRAEEFRNDDARRAPDPELPAQDALPAYEIMSGVPPSWIPLLHANGDSGRRLVRASMPGANPPAGLILTEDRGLGLFDEEVPRSGALVTRAWPYARASDGSSHLWVGRRKHGGRGEASSGLRWDVVETRLPNGTSG